MNTKPRYNTRQRTELLAYLASVAGTHITVNDVCTHFRKTGRAIGTTTVYRQLERMVEEGIVNKYIIDANSPACFEYVGDFQPKVPAISCFHCKCEKCGKLIHLHCEELAEIQGHLSGHHNFVLDPLRTVLYGLCSDCQTQS